MAKNSRLSSCKRPVSEFCYDGHLIGPLLGLAKIKLAPILNPQESLSSILIDQNFNEVLGPSTTNQGYYFFSFASSGAQIFKEITQKHI